MGLQELTLFSFIFLLLSCNNSAKTKKIISTRDTLLKQYMIVSKSDSYFDASEISVGFLEAYYRNDTTALADIVESRLKTIKRKRANKYDSCLHVLDLGDLQVDEAYRFLYWQAFCDKSLNITISKRDSLIRVRYISFQTTNDKIPCDVKDEYEKVLSFKEWEKFKEKLDHCDFWALKQENGKWGIDGNGVTVLGFIKGDGSFNKIDKYHSVYRFWVEGTDLFNPFNEIVKLSGKKLGCP